MKLTKQQQAAYNDFKKFGYVVIEGPRRSGKTTLLKHIAKGSSVSVVVLSPFGYIGFKQLGYEELGCIYVPSIKDVPAGTLVIGDEIEIPPSKKYRVACAFTKPYITHKWSIKGSTNAKNDGLKGMEEQMPEHDYRREIY